MYKILTRLHTNRPGVFRFHMVENEEGCLVEYQAETLAEVELEAIRILEKVGCLDMRIIYDEPYYIDLDYSEDEDFNEESEGIRALAMLNHMGWGDLRISDNKPFTIELCFGKRPTDTEDLFTINIQAPTVCQCEPAVLTNIAYGSTCSTGLTFVQPIDAFHFIIDGEEVKGIPSWIHYESLNDSQGILTFKAITRNHNIQIVIDGKYDTEMAMMDDKGNVYYNINEAITGCEDGAEIALLKDEVLTAGLTEVKNYTLNLNGHNLCYDPNAEALSITGTNSGKQYHISFVNTSKTESVIEGGLNFRGQGDALELEIGKNVRVISNNPVYFKGNDLEEQFVCHVKGILQTTDDTTYAAIQGNGTIGCGGSIINIYEGAHIKAADVGIYQPQNGTINVYGGLIEGTEGISMKRGNLNVYDGEIRSHGAYANPAMGNQDGSEYTGAAISLTSNDGYPGSMNVKIVNGVITGQYGNALYEGIAMKNGLPVADSSLVNLIEIQGGAFKGGSTVEAVDIIAAPNAKITGGKYSTNIEKLLTEEYQIASNKETDRQDYPFVVKAK